MNKRGQLYLLTALILVFVIFIIVIPSNVVWQTVIEDKFESLAHNFERESSKFLNEVIAGKQDVNKLFLDFTIFFTSYSKTKNPDFGLFYTFIYNDQLYIGNYLHDSITYTFQNTGPVLFHGCFQYIETHISIAGLDLTVPPPNYSTFQTCQQTIPLVSGMSNLDLQIIINDPSGGIPIVFTLSEGSPEIFIVSREKKDETRKMYLKGSFI